MNRFSRSSWALIFIIIFILSLFFFSGLYKENRIKIDAPSYYMYLPSVFIYHDIHLDYCEKDPGFFSELTYYYALPDGKRIIKHPMGMSVMLAPFFFVGHIAAFLTGSPQNGYSLPYQNAMSLGVLFYLMIGLHYLRKLLLNYFSETIVSLTLVSLVFGTNLLWYTTYAGFMSHGISFSLISICIYHFSEWIKTGTQKCIIHFSIVFALILLIRPILIVLLFYFLIIAIWNSGGIKKAFYFAWQQRNLVVLCSAIILLILFPQFLYYKYITGLWLFNPYYDEHFCFTRPEWLLFLLGFQKGWLIYTPMMWFAITGMILLYKIKRDFFYATLTTFSICIYLFSSWWWWSYASCFGMRVMVDLYAILSIPLACFFSFIFSRKKMRLVASMLIALIILLNLFQSWQFKNGLIHFDYMTKRAYLKGFFQTKASTAWYDLLKPYDYERRKLGLSQLEYSNEFFRNLKNDDLIYLRACCNLQFLSINNPYSALFSVNDLQNNEIFRVIHLTGDTIAIQSLNGKYLSLKRNDHNMIVADKVNITVNEKFTSHFIDKNDNLITIKASNNKFISVMENNHNITVAESAEAGTEGTFRFYLLQKK